MLKVNSKTLIYIIMIGSVLYACKSRKNIVRKASINIDTLETVSTPIDSVNKDIIKMIPKYETIKPIDSLKEAYENAYTELKKMLEDNEYVNFKRAVFITENAYYKGRLDYEAFNKEINKLSFICNKWIEANRDNIGYKEKDSVNFIKGLAIFKVMKDTIFSVNEPFGPYRLKMVVQYPYTYDFDDFFGKKDWSKMFVTKLIASQSGNCHSMPYLYKILSNELGATAYISLAPSHFYIKNRSKEHGWFNTELTSGEFPTDAWITASGYISLEAIRSGIFMDTLSQKQSVALCLFDLANGYKRQQKSNTVDFIIKCTDLVLKYHPNNVNAMILKAETLKNQYEAKMKSKGANSPHQLFNDDNTLKQYDEMQSLYVKALDMGYREMPERMYLEWLTSVELQKNKFTNQKISNTFKSKSKR